MLSGKQPQESLPQEALEHAGEVLGGGAEKVLERCGEVLGAGRCWGAAYAIQRNQNLNTSGLLCNSVTGSKSIPNLSSNEDQHGFQLNEHQK